jgi:uncharacterized protein (DUF1697 family)
MADKYVALLRAINLAGKNAIAMADLRAMLGRLGMTDVTTLLMSGNVVFANGKASPASLEKRLEAESARTFGFATDYFIRDASDLQAVIRNNPFPKEAAADPGHLLVVFLKDDATPAAVKALQAAVKGREIVRAKGRHAYIYYPDGVGRSKLTAALIEKHLGCRGTARNWNTVQKLAAIVNG